MDIAHTSVPSCDPPPSPQVTWSLVPFLSFQTCPVHHSSRSPQVTVKVT